MLLCCLHVRKVVVLFQLRFYGGMSLGVECASSSDSYMLRIVGVRMLLGRVAILDSAICQFVVERLDERVVLGSP